MNEKLVKDLSFEAHFRMSMLLLPPGKNDWKALADKMGYSNEEIKYFECRKEPVLDLISDYESKGNTISELMSFLTEIERDDLIEDLQKFIEATSTPEQKNLEWEKRQTEAAENNEAKTISEKYDAYIGYAEHDQPFAEEIVKRLESAPYCMKVCIDYRDLLAGGNHVDNVAQAIQTRCGKVLLILSENFNRCQHSDFITDFVLSLSPDVKKRILIPVVYTPCEIPPTLGFITRLDYTSERERRYFWDRLALSLGYSKNRSCNGRT